MKRMKLRSILLAAMLCALCVTQASALECVSTSSISLAPPQAAGLAHSAVLPFPTKSYDFAGTLIDAPEDYLFGQPTSDDTIYEWENPNVDRSKNTALVAPGFGSPTSIAQGSTTSGYTEVTSDLYYANGSLGTLKIPAIGLTVQVVQGTDSTALAKGAGHFENTSIWDGNVCLAGHNRGVNNHFGKIHTLEAGDTITLTTMLGTRTYAVTNVEKVGVMDSSGTAATTDNRITLYTCVMNESDYRWCVTAVQQ